MWMMKCTVLLLAALALLGATEATPIPLDPRPDFSSMQYQVGNWNCMVDSSRRPRPFQQSATTSMSPDGYWLVTLTVTPPVPWNAATVTNTDYVTYDPTTSQWIDISMDDHGAYDGSTSAGWTGNSIVWTEKMYQKLHGLTSAHQRTFTKVNDTKTVVQQVFAEASGKRVTVTTTCTKV